MRMGGTEYAKRIIKWVKSDEGDEGILRIMNDMTREIVDGLELNNVTIPVVTACLAEIVDNNAALMKSNDDGSMGLYENIRSCVKSSMTSITVKSEVSLDE